MDRETNSLVIDVEMGVFIRRCYPHRNEQLYMHLFFFHRSVARVSGSWRSLRDCHAVED